MPSSITLNDKQHVSAGISILDADGQPFATKPEGSIVEFSSSNPSVASFVVDESGMNGDVASGLVGSAIISASVLLADGTNFSDTLSVAVQNSAPGAINFTVGTPVDE